MFQPVIPWIGGKRRLAKEILPMFPKHTCYCEPFCGGAALFFMKQPSKVEVLNDFSSELVALYRVLQHHLEEFIRQYKWALVSRQMFEWLSETPPETLTEIQRAARFFYLQKMAFGGKVNRRTFGTATASPPRLNLTRIEEDLSQAHSGWPGAISKTSTGNNASRSTIAQAPCSFSTRPTGKPKATESPLESSNTTSWPS